MKKIIIGERAKLRLSYTGKLFSSLVLAVFFLFALSSTGFAFTPDPLVKGLADKMDEKYFPIFQKTLLMINAERFEGLGEFYADSLFVKGKFGKRSISVKDWASHPKVYFKSEKHLSSPLLDEKGYELNFPIDWGADPANDKTWVFNFQNLLWLNDYLREGERGDEAATLTAFKVIRDFIVSNAQWPPRHGRFIYDDHATAERLKVFYRAMRLYQKSPFNDDEFYNLLLTGIINHISLMATEEKYLNWHNHGIIFDLSLLEVLGDFEEFKPKQDLRELAIRRIQEQFKFSFTEEGVHREHSPCYHFFVTGMLLKAIDLIEKSGRTAPAALSGLIDGGAEFYASVLMPDGTFPNIGDCSGRDTWVIPMQLGDDYYDHHPGLKYSVTHGREGKRPNEDIKIFPESGWAIFRDGWPTNVYVAVQSDFNSFGHYQEDDTSFLLQAYGHDMVIDTGIHSYNKNPFDIYMRKSRAHNVLVADVGDFDFNLKNTGLSGITRYQLNKNGEDKWQGIVELTHPHYEDRGITVYRQFGQMDGSNFMVKDIVESRSAHKYTQLFHLAPGAKIDYRGNGTFRITWLTHPYGLWLRSNTESYDIIDGAMEPVQGWYFPKFGVAAPQPVLSLHWNAAASGELVTLLSVTKDEAKPDWEVLQTKAREMSGVVGKLPRRVLEKRPVPPRWQPSSKKTKK